MANKAFQFRWAIAALALGAGLAAGPTGAADGRSSPEDRQRFVAIARNLERAPLEPGLKADRDWALAWLAEAPDVMVTMCAGALGGSLDSDYRYEAEIVLQDMFSMGAFAIDHPEAAIDPAAQQLAGVEGALNAYRAIVRDKPEARSPILEKLLQSQARGELPELVRKAVVRCSAKK